jgi:hypothetical protein
MRKKLLPAALGREIEQNDLLMEVIACGDSETYSRSPLARGERWHGKTDSCHGFDIDWGLPYDAQTCRQHRGIKSNSLNGPSCLCGPCRYQTDILRKYEQVNLARAVQEALTK